MSGPSLSLVSLVLRALVAAAFLAALPGPAIRAQEGFRAETGFDFWASDDAQRASASVRWYPAPDRRWVAQFGARVGGERLDFGSADVTAVTVGAFGGVSHAVGRIWPTVTLGLDRPFREGGVVDLETTATLGARWFVAGKGSASYAIHFGGFRTDWAGASGRPDRAGYGIFAGLHQSRLSAAAWRRLGPEGSRGDLGLVGREVELQAAGAPGDYWTGFSLDSFFPQGRTDFGFGMQRLCLDDPTNDLTACGWAGELRGEWHLGTRDGRFGEFADTFVPYAGLSGGTVQGRARTYYGAQGSLWAGVRWQPGALPFSVHVAAIGRRLVARDGFEDRTVGGVQVGLSFR
jgi:hypothetical protein